MPFTDEQNEAINDRNHDILVSASAGSGKTTVLVERVLNEILNGRNVDELLIVTFTKAAAEEMKSRIKVKLEETIKQEHGPKRIFLQQQLNQIDTANISTIDAFCLEVIHRFYYAINLDPSFSVLTDETQATLLKERALQEVETEKLEIPDQDFIDFYNNFAGDRDAEPARDLLLDLYNFAMAKPDYLIWLKSLVNSYEIDSNIVTSPFWQNQIKPYLMTVFANIEQEVKQLLSQDYMQAEELGKVYKSFTTFERNLLVFIDSLQKDNDYNDLREKLGYCTFTVRFAKSKKWDEDIQEFYKERVQTKKDQINKQIYDIFTSFFASDEAEQIAVTKKAKRIVKAIVQAEQSLIEHFGQLKREENLIDYSDMEQFAYQILSQDTSNSQLARDYYRDQFKEILIDEYQDINPLQEKIIQLLKKDKQNNVFMVGDVKQSIYGFRQAEPTLFLQKYHDFGQKDQAGKERILLSDNFRSTKPVTEIVNHLFSTVLTRDFGGIDYQEEGRLIFGAKYYPKFVPKATEVIFHEKNTNDNIIEDDEQFDFSEIEMVIQRIKHFKEEGLQIYDSKIGQERPFRYSDIVILTRSRSNNLEIMQEFAKNNLPLFVTDAENYFQTFELTIVMNYLKIIDNPDQDIPLVTVLRSPLFNFTEKELAKIRINNKAVSFYNALLAYVGIGNSLSERIKDFLNELASLRDFSATHRISELIWSIYERTNLLEIMTALPNGEQRRVNLESLYERASSYESAGFKGLYQFINFINRMRKSKKDLAQPLLTKEADDSVRLMTIHGSKGLEFPIVFFVGLEHHYQMRDLNGNYVLTNNGMGLTIKTPAYRVDTLVKAIGNVNKKRQVLEEEARILYVALTRAKQKLILVADIPKMEEKLKNWATELENQSHLTLSEKLSANSPLSFLGPGLANILNKQIAQKMSDISSTVDQSQDLIFIKYDNQEPIDAQVNEEKNVDQSNETHDKLKAVVKELYSFQYPFKDATQTNAYKAVSEFKKASNDPDDKELENSKLIPSTNRYLQPIDTTPSFLFETKFTGAEIGTATHLILQYYDYKGNGSPEQLENEIQDLIKRKKLNPDIVPSISKEAIEWFVHSDFSKKFWLHPENLKREVDFSSLRPAYKSIAGFSDKSARILVHGTIDGYYIDDDGIALFDYKTDHVDKNHEQAAINNIKSKYNEQLNLYEEALNSFSKQKVKSKYLILLDAQKIVQVH